MSHDQLVEICASMLVGAIIGGATVMVCFIKTGRCNHYGKYKTLDNHVAGKSELQGPIENLSRPNTVSSLGKNVLKKVREIETSISCLNHTLYHKANMGLKWSYQKDSGSSDSMEQDSNYSTCNSMDNEDDVKDNSNDGYSSANDCENNQEIHLDHQEKCLNSGEDKGVENDQILGTDHTDVLVHATDGDSSFNESNDSVSKEVCKIKLNDEDLILPDHEDDSNNDMHLNIGNRQILMEHSGSELINCDIKPRKIENRENVHNELSYKMTHSSEIKCGSETNNHKGCPTYHDFKTDEFSYPVNHSCDSDLKGHRIGPFRQITSNNQHEEVSNVSHGHKKMVHSITVEQHRHENKIRRYSHGDRYSRNSAHPHVSNTAKLNNTSHREDGNWLKDHDVSNEKESQRNTSHASSINTSVSEASNVPFNHELLSHSMTGESTILSKDHEASSHHAHRTTANRASFNVKHPNEATNYHERSMHSLTVESYQHEPRNRSYSHGDRYLRTNTFRDGILAKDHFRSTDLSKHFDLTRTSQQNHPKYIVEEQRLKDHSVSQTNEHQRKISHVSSVTKPHKETDVSSSTKPHKETHVSSSTKPHKETHVSSSTKPHKETHSSLSTKPHKETHISSSTKPKNETSNAANDLKRSMLTVTREETRNRRYSHGDKYQRNSTSPDKVLSGDNFGSTDFSMDLDIPKTLQQNHTNYMVEEQRLEDHSTTQKNEHPRKISHVSSNNTSHKGNLNAANDQKHSMLTVTRDETRNRRYSHGDRYQRSTTFPDSGLTTENFRSTDFSVDPPVTTVSQQNHTHYREDELTTIQRRRKNSSSNDGSFSQELSLRNKNTDVHKPSSPQHQHLNLPQKTDDKDISMFRAITQRLRVKRNKTSEKDHTSDLDSNSYDTSDRSSSGSVHSDTGSSHSIDRPAESKQSSYLIRSRKPRIKVSDVQEVNVLDKETSMTDQSVTVSHRVLGKSRNEHIKNMDDEQNLERVARSRAYSSGGELSRKSKFISKSMDTSSHSETSSIDDDVVGPMPPAVEAYLRKGRRTSFHKALESDLMDDDVFERKDKGTGKQTRIDSSLDRRSRKDNFKTETSDVDLPMTQKTSEKKQNVIESKPRHRVSIAGSDIGPGIPPLIDNPRQYSSTMSLDHPHHLFAKNPKHRESSWVSRHHKVYSWELTPNIIKRERSRTPDGRRSRSLPDKRHERTRSRASVESSLPDKRQERMRSHSSVESPGLEKLRSHSFVDRHKDDRHKDDEKQSTHTGVLPIFKHKRAKHV